MSDNDPFLGLVDDLLSIDLPAGLTAVTIEVAQDRRVGLAREKKFERALHEIRNVSAAKALALGARDAHPVRRRLAIVHGDLGDVAVAGLAHGDADAVSGGQ